MLDLSDVTLCCVDTANHVLALRALARSQAGVAFARTLFLTHDVPAGVQIPAGVEARDIGPLGSRTAYSEFVLKSLLRHVDTPHVLLVQWDGFVVNPSAWRPAFLQCDYLGAKWFWQPEGLRVGNGGFSLRSRRLLQALQDPRIRLIEVEDETIGRSFRPLLEREHGIVFADEALADRFSFEAAYPIGKPFGFHGLFNFCRTLPQEEIAALAPMFSSAIARSAQAAQLLRNCAALGQWAAVDALAVRILHDTPEHAEAKALLERARAALAQPAAVGRNDPCPCGSGRKYKQCHGAIGASAPAREVSSGQHPGSIDEALKNALAAHQRGDLSAAEGAYRGVLALAPDQPVATHYLGVILYQRRQVSDALPLLERAAAAVPHEAEFHNNLGLALAAADRNEEAIGAHRRALALRPDHAAAWNNLGLALVAANRLPEAIDAYRQAIARAPQFAQAHWNLALALLAQGDFEEGWREYDWRLALAELGKTARVAPGVRWDGAIVPGKTLLLVAEQGLGDAIQFARFARPLAERGMRVVLQVPAVLRRLLATVPGVAEVVTPEAELPAYDFHLPLLSVARALGIGADGIPADTPYIEASAARRAEASRAVEPYAGRLKIGLCWSGSALYANDARRSIAFDALRPLLDVPGAAFFSLQYASNAGAPLIELDARNPLDDTAALITELDLILTVDTSIGHLAAAMDRPTWLLLPFAPDWRWQLDRSDSPWYRSVRLFRQPATGDWPSVIARVAGELRELASRCAAA